jgi:hypothetical protein
MLEQQDFEDLVLATTINDIRADMDGYLQTFQSHHDSLRIYFPYGLFYSENSNTP